MLDICAYHKQCLPHQLMLQLEESQIKVPLLLLVALLKLYASQVTTTLSMEQQTSLSACHVQRDTRVQVLVKLTQFQLVVLLEMFASEL